MSLKVGIVRFLGTNCDEDVRKWFLLNNHKPDYLWFNDQFSCNDYDLVIIPGGFSYGDYLRCGALAARTNVMKSVREFANIGKPVLGICNGFQILCEAGLLPGALLKNVGQRFIDQWQTLDVKNTNNYFSKKMTIGQTIKLPIAHGEGNYFAESDTLKKMFDQQQIWLTYQQNPNGSLLNISGITNEKHNICGLMPHPERALFDWMGSSDGGFFL
ncbi:MAG: phosphoribosylformylglycinamidine synthase subunit PurQ [Pseudobdellovibrio sp.]